MMSQMYSLQISKKSVPVRQMDIQTHLEMAHRPKKLWNWKRPTKIEKHNLKSIHTVLQTDSTFTFNNTQCQNEFKTYKNTDC